jgi:hypothetical protein
LILKASSSIVNGTPYGSTYGLVGEDLATADALGNSLIQIKLQAQITLSSLKIYVRSSLVKIVVTIPITSYGHIMLILKY